MQNFGYDATDRLSSVVANGSASESYTYDAVGNRTSSLTDTELAYASFNRLTSIRRGAYWDPNSSRSYDNNGNLIQGPFYRTGLSSSEAESYTAYSYDFENRLTQVVKTWRDSLFSGWNYTTVNYQYDALGRRVARSTSNDDVQKFVYDGQDVVEDLDDSGQFIASYLNGPGVDNKIRQSDANGNLYFSTDHLGSTNALTNDSGQVVEGIGYDSFGNSTGSSYTRYTYTGRELDADTGLYYYRARWYDPTVGRFVSEDPIGFLGEDVNFYGYVRNGSLLFRDPTGLRRCDPWVGALVGAGVGGVIGIVGGTLAGPIVGAEIGAAAGVVVGTPAGPAGEFLGGGGGAVAGAIAGRIAGPYVGGILGAGIGGYIGYRICSGGDDTCDRTDARPWTPNPLNPERENDCFKRCEHLIGVGDQGIPFTNCYKTCMGRTIE